LNHGPYSAEARLVTEITKKIITGRIGLLISRYAHYRKTYDEGVVTAIFSQFFDVSRVDELKLDGELRKDLQLASASRNPEDALRYRIPVAQVFPALETGKTKLTDLYIAQGYAFLSLSSLVAMAEAVLEVSIRKYMGKISKKGGEVRELKPLVEAISKAAAEPEYLSNYQRRFYQAVSPGAGAKRSGSALKPEFFPPCVKHVLQGVSSGSRNYAVTVLLTSFVSYARIAPVGSRKDARISDYIKDARVLEEEVLPLIFEAAQRCSPPLFADQPMEKMNIYYHLGLGMSGEANLDYAGRSNWYFPPNCDKIRREAPSLCHPDKHCGEIKNPLSYYTKKLFTKKGAAKGKRGARATLKGRITQIYGGSGLIQRCPKCKRRIMNDLCVVHGDVEGAYDLRIKARFENERTTQILLLREAAESILGITLEEARKIGEAAVLEKIRLLAEKNFEVRGERLRGGNFLVKSIRRLY
jgi:DNA primase large subunit